MSAIHELRDSAPARALRLLHTTAAALRTLGWRVSESAFFDGGIADIAADRVWSRSNLQAHVRLLISGHSGAEQILFSELPAATTDDMLAVHTLIDSGRIRPAVVTPPRSRTHASSFREIGGDSFRVVVEQTFASVEAIRDTLRKHDLEVIADDLDEETRIDTVDLLHPIIVTDAAIWTMTDRIAPKKSVRLLQSAITGGEHRWIDIVRADSIDAFLAATTKHYESRYKKFGRPAKAARTRINS